MLFSLPQVRQTTLQHADNLPDRRYILVKCLVYLRAIKEEPDDTEVTPCQSSL
uniref:Uncharacterized protein n=1 Tax=Anguilla anguilla TaxID=7936 RepID=A0A0E9SDQ8_ANGAN